MMRALLLLLLLAALPVASWSQTTRLGGIINTYASVVAIDKAAGTITVAGTAGFSSGDPVLIVQMQGATIDQTNGPAYGAVLGYGSAGNYEIGWLRCVDGATLTLAGGLRRTYDPAGQVQVVRLPRPVSHAVIDRTVTCEAWDGSTGGIVALMADTIELSAPIDVSGKGFRGGVFVNARSAPHYYVTDYAGVDDPDYQARKGEGIARTGVAPLTSGKGAPANAGGGGNNHNAGGGGGAGFGCGGNGGWAYYLPSYYSGDHRDALGIGGHPIPYGDASLGQRLSLGGGGGAGHGNNNAATDGASGAGAVVLMASVIISSDQLILAHGATARSAAPDGAGGGGGGGTVLLAVDRIQGKLLVDVAGGDGGVCGIETQDVGPGGGGGGGLAWVKPATLPAGLTVNAAAGVNGYSKNFGRNAPGYGDSTYGSTPGCLGGTLFGLDIPLGSRLDIAVEIGPSATLCAGDSTRLHAALRGSDGAGLTYRWTPSVGVSDPASPDPMVHPSTTTTYSVTITEPGGCQHVAEVVVRVLPMPTVAIDGPLTICDRESTTLTVSSPYATYRWSTGESSRAITVDRAGSYAVTVTTEQGCTATASVDVTIRPRPTIDLARSFRLCKGESRTLSVSGGVSYLWSPSAGLSCATCPNPVARPDSTTTYRVIVVDANGCVAVDSVTVAVVSGLVTVGGAPGSFPELAFDTTMVNENTCREITLFNADSLPYTVTAGTLFHNGAFSAPPEQFPLTIPPHGSAPLVVCFAPRHAGAQEDTLEMDVCPKLAIRLSSVATFDALGTNCRTTIRIRSTGGEGLLKLGAPHPNPASTAVSVPVTLQGLTAEAAGVSRGELFDHLGRRVAEGVYGGERSASVPGLEHGELTLDLRSVPQGAYYLRLATAQGTVVVPISVTR